MESLPNTNPPSAAAVSYPSSLPSDRPVGRTGSPPWTQIVRGPDSESTGAPSDISLSSEIHLSESVDNSGNAGSKKPAWNKKPVNGSVVDTGPVVMGGAASWPALSESTKASPKLSPSDSPKNLADLGSIPAPVSALQVTGLASSSSLSSSPLSSSSQSSLSASQKPTTSNANANHFSSNNHGRPVRQKSIKRDGGGNAQANGGFSHQSLPHGEGLSNNHSSDKPSSRGGNDSSGRDNSQNHSNRDSGLRNATAGDHHQPRSNSFRRQNSGSHSRGDGTHQNHVGRRGDQDRGNHDWNHQRSFNGRDAPPMQSRGIGPRGFVRPPPVSAPFVQPGASAPMGPFINPMMPDMPMIYYPPGVPFVSPVHPSMFFPVPDPQLLVNLVTQIDYYFSNENLIRDTYLRQNMDQNGWVPVSLIAGFKKPIQMDTFSAEHGHELLGPCPSRWILFLRNMVLNSWNRGTYVIHLVMQLTDNIQLILDAVLSSTVLETQGDKIRRRDDWMRWVMPPALPSPTTPSLQLPETLNVATLSADIQSVSLNERTTEAKAEVLSKSSSGNLSSSLHANNDGAASSGC